MIMGKENGLILVIPKEYSRRKRLRPGIPVVWWFHNIRPSPTMDSLSLNYGLLVRKETKGPKVKFTIKVE